MVCISLKNRKNEKAMKRFILFILLLFLVVVNFYAQSKCHIDVDYHYNLGLSEKIVGRHYTRSAYKMGGNSLRFAMRYDISTVFSTGIGVGLDRYTEVDFNTMPVYATMRYSPIKKVHDAYVFSDLGYALKIAQDYNPGFTGKVGLGYVWYVANHFGVNFQIAYDFKDFRKISTISYDEENQKNIYYDTNNIRHSISFGVGITF